MTVMPEYNDLAYSLAGVKRRNPFDSRRAFAQKLQAQGGDTSPVDHPLQGAARLAQALVGGWMGGQADRDEQASVEKGQAALAAAMAEPDPQKRIAMLGAADPALGARLSGQMAIEQAKLGQQQAGLQTAAQNFGGSYGMGGQGGPQSASVPPLPGGTPNASGFNNNLGNIRATPINWDGKGAPHNGFETFNTPQAGANAMVRNLGAYAQANPNITVAQAIAKWAPPNENNTDLYIRQLAESTGINPGMPLAEVLKDPAVAAQMLDAITRKEKGGLPQGVNADTFMTATTPGGQQQPQQPGQPLTINMNQPQGIPQGDNIGMPPAPSPQVVGGPTVQAAPAVPEVPRPRPSTQQIQQYQQRLATGEFGTDQGAVNRARAALEAELDRDWSVQREQAKMKFGQQTTEYSEQRKAQREQEKDDRTRGQPSRQEIEKLHTARTEAATIVSALADFQREFQNTSTFGAVKSVLGATTPVNTAYNTAALLAKGEQLFNLGVLNGPDLDIIRRTLPDPSTIRGATATTADMSTAVGKIIDLLQTRLTAREKQLGLPATDVRGAANEIRSTMPGGPAPAPAGGPIAAGAIEDGYRFKGGNPADPNSWEKVR